MQIYYLLHEIYLFYCWLAQLKKLVFGLRTLCLFVQVDCCFYISKLCITIFLMLLSDSRVLEFHIVYQTDVATNFDWGRGGILETNL